MNLEERLQKLMLDRDRTLATMEEQVQQIQHLLWLLAQQAEHERPINRIKRFF